jgi:diadenosine tetraphosphate (Ap4A) HIT family hydrolase
MTIGTDTFTLRNKQTQQEYESWLRHRIEQFGGNPPCPFCEGLSEQRIIHETPLFAVIENKFPYESNDGQRVKHHYLIVPRRHIDRFTQFTDEEVKDYWDIAAYYHEKGYSLETRSFVDAHRSIPEHIHTHLFAYVAAERSS